MASPKDAPSERQVPKDLPPLPEPEPILYTAPAGGVVAGQAYLINGQLVIADAPAGAGATFAGQTTGVVEYAKAHEEIWAVGDPVYWAPEGGCLSIGDKSPSGIARVRVGVAEREARRPSVTGFVRMDNPTP